MKSSQFQKAIKSKVKMFTQLRGLYLFDCRVGLEPHKQIIDSKDFSRFFTP